MKQIVLNKVFYQRLSLLFLIILFSSSVVWADDSGSCGENATWTYETASHTLTISGTGAISAVPWEIYKGCGEGGANPSPDNAITSIVIKEGITSICSYAFGGCYYATSVGIPSTVTSIGDYAFADCHSLTSVSIPDNVTTIGYAAFASNYLLEEISIPEGVTTIGYFAFFDCPSLQRASISSTVTSIGFGAFQYAEYDTEHHQGSKLTSVTFAKNSKLTAIGSEVFKKCTALEEITIPARVTSIGYCAFEDCNHLTTIELLSTAPPSLDSDAFKGCNNLSSIIVPAGKGDIYKNAQDWSGYSSKITSRTSGSCGDNATWSYSNGTLTIDGYGAMDDFQGTTPWEGYIINDITKVVISTGITSIGKNAFLGSHKLADITIPTSVTSIGEFAFAACLVLEGITIPEGVTTIGDYAFYECEKLQTVNISSTVTRIGKYAFAANTSSNPVSELVSVTFANNSNLTTIDDYAFSACINLSNITIPNSVTSIGASAFADCYNITAFTIPNSVTSIGEMAFAGCKFTEISIPNSVTTIASGTFSYCDELETINFSSSITSIGGGAFENCHKLQSVHLSGCNNLTTIGNDAFAECTVIHSISFPASLTNFGNNFNESTYLYSITVDGENPNYKAENDILFTKDGTTLLIYPKAKEGNSYTIPDDVTTIGDAAFKNCSNLNTVIIPASVTSIGNYAFYGCPLTAITVNGNNSSYMSVDDVLFSKDGTTLITYPRAKTSTTYTVPASVTTISSSAFSGCNYLTQVVIPRTEAVSIGSNFYMCDNLQKIYVPAALKDTYKTNTSTLADKFKAYASVSISNGSNGTIGINNNTSALTIGENKYYTEGTTITLTVAPNENYSVGTISYNDGSDHTINPVNDVYSLTMPTSNVTVSGTFVPKSYSITYELNGGTMPAGITNPESYTVETSDFTLNAPIKTGYTFAGWTGTGLTEATTNVTIATGSTGARTYTANWTAENYAITYNLNGGALPEGKTNPATYTIESDDITLNNPTRTYYNFTGWTGTGLSEATSTVKINSGSTGARAYTANWTAKSYSITYDLNGGTMPEGKTNPTTYTVESEDISLNAPTKTGYTFAGWTGTDLTSATKTVTITQGSTGNRNYTATWTINQYTITFDSNGGSNVAPITQDYGSTITAPADPVRKDYIFDGWDKEIPKKMPAENITITAKWREVLISPENKVTVNGEIFYMMPDNTVSVIFSNIKAFLALTQKAADCATINSNGGIDFAKGQNVHILIMNLIKGQVIIFNINGHIAVDSSSLSPKKASSRAASSTRADGYIELESGVEYEVQKSGNIMLSIQLEYEPVTINSIKVGSGSTGIEEVSPSTGSGANSEKWYDLNGRQLNAKPTIPGLYIRNGKKIQIK